MRVLGYADSEAQARALARELGVPYAGIDVHRFPDGESRVRVPTDCPGRVVVVRSLDRPNDKLVELLLAAGALRAHGVRELTLIAPYLCYMRQDIEFTPGEAVSQRLVGGWLAQLFDAVVTVDPHLHRVATLGEALPGIRAVSLSAAPLLGRLAAQRLDRPLLVGPDEESAQWVAQAAAAGGLDCRVGTKRRHGDREVEIDLALDGVAGRPVVLLDDMLSTGRTLVQAARLLAAAGAGPIHAAVTHALHGAQAAAALAESPIVSVWSTDSVAHATNAVALAPLLAQALRESS